MTQTSQELHQRLPDAGRVPHRQLDQQTPILPEKAALEGSFGIPNRDNRYLTEDDATATPTANRIPRWDANVHLNLNGEGVIMHVHEDDVTGVPTHDELNSAFGDHGSLPEGYMAVLNDEGAGDKAYLVMTMQEEWFVLTFSKAVGG